MPEPVGTDGGASASKGGTKRGTGIAWVAGLLAAAGAGYAGWRATVPLYAATAIVEVRPVVPKILFASDANGTVPMFDAYIQSQAAIAGSRRVADMAQATPEWAGSSRPGTGASFHERLRVARRPGATHLDVTFRDADPTASAVGANEAAKAYLRIVDERDATGDLARLQALEGKRLAYNNRMTEMRAEIQATTDELGTEGLDSRYRSIAAKLERIEAAIAQDEIDAARSGEAGPAGSSSPARARLVALRDQTVAEMQAISKQSARVASLKAEQAQLSAALDEVRRRLDEVRTESMSGGRISLVMSAHRPESPETDRRAPLAAAGGLLGFVLGFGVARVATRRRGDDVVPVS